MAAYPDGAAQADDVGRLPLHWAAQAGHSEIVELLKAADPVAP